MPSYKKLLVLLALFPTACNVSTDTLVKNGPSWYQEPEAPQYLLPNCSFPPGFADSADSSKHLTRDQCLALQLDKVSRFKDRTFDEAGNFITLSRTLYSKGRRQVLLVTDHQQGEAAAYLVAYNAEGNYTGDVEMVYRDYTKYLKTVFSSIRKDVIEIRTVINAPTDDTLKERFILDEHMVLQKEGGTAE